jgi:hypothetical protein
MIQAGVTVGMLLFDGERVGWQYQGIAYVFAPHCAPFGYNVAGPISSDEQQVTLYGQAPVVDTYCNIVGYRPDTLVFTLIQAPPPPVIITGPAQGTTGQGTVNGGNVNSGNTINIIVPQGTNNNNNNNNNH